MISKKNWFLYKRYLEYRLSVDQISEGSLLCEQTHLRYVLEWAQERSFRNALEIRPTFPEFLLANPMSMKKKQLSPQYIKKVLATVRLFFTYLSENESGYKHLKPAWIKKIKVKRLISIPRYSEAVSLDEVMAIAARPARSVRARRARAAMVFLFLSGMRIGAFVTLPIQAVDISNRVIYQLPHLGVRTKNSKSIVSYLLDIPELLQVIKTWDDEVRSILPPNGYWFAPLHFHTGEIDQHFSGVGKHRINLARRDFDKWLLQENLPVHSPHKFRHGHIHYAMQHAKNAADMKAVCLNVGHADIKTTDQFYSVLGGDEIKNRISALNKEGKATDNKDIAALLRKLASEIEGA